MWNEILFQWTHVQFFFQIKEIEDASSLIANLPFNVFFSKLKLYFTSLRENFIKNLKVEKNFMAFIILAARTTLNKIVSIWVCRFFIHLVGWPMVSSSICSEWPDSVKIEICRTHQRRDFKQCQGSSERLQVKTNNLFGSEFGMSDYTICGIGRNSLQRFQNIRPFVQNCRY